MNRRDFLKALVGVAVTGVGAKPGKLQENSIAPNGCITVEGEVVKLMHWDHDSMSAEFYAEKQRQLLDRAMRQFEYDA